MDKKQEALAKYLEIDLEGVCHLEGSTYEAEGHDWCVYTDDEANEACYREIREIVWSFNSSFLESHISALTADDIDRLRGDRCEDVNEALVKLIDDFDYFVEDAVCSDGRGLFLAGYDHEEVELDGDLFAYRQ